MKARLLSMCPAFRARQSHNSLIVCGLLILGAAAYAIGPNWNCDHLQKPSPWLDNLDLIDSCKMYTAGYCSAQSCSVIQFTPGWYCWGCPASVGETGCRCTPTGYVTARIQNVAGGGGFGCTIGDVDPCYCLYDANGTWTDFSLPTCSP